MIGEIAVKKIPGIKFPDPQCVITMSKKLPIGSCLSIPLTLYKYVHFEWAKLKPKESIFALDTDLNLISQ